MGSLGRAPTGRAVAGGGWGRAWFGNHPMGSPVSRNGNHTMGHSHTLGEWARAG